MALDALGRRLIDRFQDGLPLTGRPYAVMGEAVDADEDRVLSTLRRLADRGVLSRVGPVFAPHAFGASTLAAASVPPAQLVAAAEVVSACEEVNHNYEREHALNLWFVVTAPTRARVTAVLAELAARIGVEILDLPMLESYHVDLGFAPWREIATRRPAAPVGTLTCAITGADRRLAAATERGLALSPRPFDQVATRLGCDARSVRDGLARLRAGGAIRRLGLVVRHHELGFRANAMVVMDVADTCVADAGRALAEDSAVTLCYRRPRRPPRWRYNLFCMVHGRDRDLVRCEAGRLVALSGARDSAVLFSQRRFKQRGARYGVPG